MYVDSKLYTRRDFPISLRSSGQDSRPSTHYYTGTIKSAHILSVHPKGLEPSAFRTGI